MNLLLPNPGREISIILDQLQFVPVSVLILAQKRQLIVITKNEIDNLRTTQEMTQLIKGKLCLLAVSGRII